MCILFIAIDQHPNFPLIIAANRDEYHARPSQTLHRWQNSEGIWAGRDLQAGGTWLGVNESGQFAAVTNFRTATTPNPEALSRGELVVKALSGATSIDDHHSDTEQFDQFLDRSHQRYNPFNLVYGDVKKLQAWDYRAGARRQLETGFHSISNGPIDDLWPKMAQGVEEVASMISRRGDLDPAKMMKMMQDQTKAPANKLPETGIALEKEQMLSSIFIKGEDYGTRTTTILLIGYKSAALTETNYATDSSIISTTHKTLRF